MSILSRVLIGVILTGLAFIAGVHLYRGYERYAEQTQPSAAATQTFNQIPVSYEPLPPDTPVYKRYPEEGAEPEEVYLEDPVLAPEQEKEQAQQTIQSILADYQENDKVKAFYADLKKATGQSITLADLSGQNLAGLMKQYPQIQEVIGNYAKDPEFAGVMQEVFANPQFAHSIAVLQRPAPRP